MKIRGIEVDNPIEVQTTIWKCPNCSKKFTHKGSYYNHISKNYCWFSAFKYFEEKQRYEKGIISKKDFYMWCYENDYAHLLPITKEDEEILEEEFYKKICSLYEWEDYEY